MISLKTVFQDEKIIIYLRKVAIHDFDLSNEEKLEQYFKDLFLSLKNRYNIEMNGYYNVDVYPDIHYGMILEIENMDVDYYRYFSQIDMKINVLKNSSFLYEIDFECLDKIDLKKCMCYKQNDKIYLQIKENIDDIALGSILEYARIIYGDKTHDILKYSKKVRL